MNKNLQRMTDDLLPSVFSETGTLTRVIIGEPARFVLPEPINQKQRYWLENPASRPDPATLVTEFDGMQAALEAQGVEVLRPTPVDGVPDQLTPRDIGVVIGDVFVQMHMATECRANEWQGIRQVIDTLPAQHFLEVPSSAVLEGGDVVVDRDFIFVGTGERSNAEGVRFLQEHFSEKFTVVEVPLLGEAEGHDILHLDCAFVPVGKSSALIYPDGLARIPEALQDQYDWIEVTQEEQLALATNVLSLSPTTVLSRNTATRTNDILRERGINVIEIEFNETPKGGGSFRCASLPLNRETQ